MSDIRFREPPIQVSLPQGWDVWHDDRLKLVTICPGDEYIGKNRETISHFVTIQVLPLGDRGWVAFVSNLMRRRLGNAPLNMEPRFLAGKETLWTEWTDGVASMESWFLRFPSESSLVEICAGVDKTWDRAPRAEAVRAVLQSIKWLDVLSG